MFFYKRMFKLPCNREGSNGVHSNAAHRHVGELIAESTAEYC